MDKPKVKKGLTDKELIEKYDKGAIDFKKVMTPFILKTENKTHRSII